ncbi:unnamed protein product [Linum trigynum]|uniref:Secreted protein n=1 Tax=Linum trigynum TaxID=586398 RepID=A0AAV2GU30_9ROSI
MSSSLSSSTAVASLSSTVVVALVFSCRRCSSPSPSLFLGATAVSLSLLLYRRRSLSSTVIIASLSSPLPPPLSLSPQTLNTVDRHLSPSSSLAAVVSMDPSLSLSYIKRESLFACDNTSEGRTPFF